MAHHLVHFIIVWNKMIQYLNSYRYNVIILLTKYFLRDIRGCLKLLKKETTYHNNSMVFNSSSYIGREKQYWSFKAETAILENSVRKHFFLQYHLNNQLTDKSAKRIVQHPIRNYSSMTLFQIKIKSVLETISRLISNY